MCTKKELVEWLEANVPDDADVSLVEIFSGTRACISSLTLPRYDSVTNVVFFEVVN